MRRPRPPGLDADRGARRVHRPRRFLRGETPSATRSGSARTRRPPSRPTPPRARVPRAGRIGRPLRVWLNGGELTAGAAHRRLRRHSGAPIDLRAGANLLVVKSCEDVGAWYFVARITDADGRDLPDLASAAALPAQPIPPAAAPPPRHRSSWRASRRRVRADTRIAHYGDYRGGGASSWAYVEDQDREVSWRTAPVAGRPADDRGAHRVHLAGERRRAAVSSTGAPAVAFPIGTAGRRRALERETATGWPSSRRDSSTATPASSWSPSPPTR